MSVGDVAARLGVTPSTVRMWGQRYGLTASSHSPGGHRRYTRQDVELLQRMHAEVISGTSPADAAASVKARGGTSRPAKATLKASTKPEGSAVVGGGSSRQRSRSRPGGPGGSVLAVPGAGLPARGLARAAFRLDEIGVEDSVVAELKRHGTLATWNDVIRPVLVASGDYWQRTGEGIEIEHLLTQAVATALVRHVAALGEPSREDPVLLAAGPHEEHTLALHAVRAGLAERGVPSRLLGPRTPGRALAAAARRTRAPAVLVWLSQADPIAIAEIPSVSAAHRRITVLLGGAGWGAAESLSRMVCGDLNDALDRLHSAWLSRPAGTSRA